MTILRKFSSPNWRTIIGLEIHAQLASKHKLFSAALNDMDSVANTNVAPFDAAIPGSLPILNNECVELALRAALALECAIQKESQFDRKHYHYADLPAGYQITQHLQPFAVGGIIPIKPSVTLKQIQIEQDTGKSFYSNQKKLSLIDLNRCGIGLIEIVTNPEIYSVEHALAAAKYINENLKNLGVCRGILAQGHMRFDVNVSIVNLNAPNVGLPLGERVEIKNINTFSGLAQAIEYESKRQIALLEAGEMVRRETRSYDELTKRTVKTRDKESSLDYRFIPEFDLPPLVITEESIELVRKSMPEMSWQKVNRLSASYGISVDQTKLLVEHKFLLHIFETCIKFAPIKLVYDFLMNKYLGLCQRFNRQVSDQALINVIRKLSEGTLSRTNLITSLIVAKPRILRL